MKPRSAAPFVPPNANLSTLQKASQKCRGCDLYKYATQTVFGEGPQKTQVVLVGEQPGDQEDKQGHPFVGPAGKLLDKALEEAQLDRTQVYITNVVKHFKFKLKGKFRFHQKPSGIEIRACRPWLEAELALLQPNIIVSLGASAAEGLLGHKVTIRDERGHFIPSPFGPKLLVTVHPSSILRIPDQDGRHAEYAHFVADLKLVKKAIS